MLGASASCQCMAKVTVKGNDTILVGTASGWQPAKVLSKAPEDDTLDLAFPSGASPRVGLCSSDNGNIRCHCSSNSNSNGNGSSACFPVFLVCCKHTFTNKERSCNPCGRAFDTCKIRLRALIKAGPEVYFQSGYVPGRIYWDNIPRMPPYVFFDCPCGLGSTSRRVKGGVSCVSFQVTRTATWQKANASRWTPRVVGRLPPS